MSVEGLWCFQTARVEAPDEFQYGGVVVLETGRVLGGDSVMAYVGDFEVTGVEIVAKVRSYQWNPAFQEVENVFGMKGPGIDYMVDLKGQREGDMIHGVISPEDHPQFQLPIRMLHMTDLPG